MKQNSAIATMIPAPVTVRLLCTKSENVSSPPPLPDRCFASPAPSAPGSPAAALVAASGIAIADPWIEYPVGDVSGQVPDNRGDADDERGPEHDRVIVGQRRLPEQQAHAGEVEDRFSDH